MDPIYDLPPDLPKHAAPPLRPVASRVIKTWPAGTFVENAALLPDGALAVSVHSANTVERIDLANGGHRSVTTLPASPTGLAVLGHNLYVAVGNPGQSPGTLWAIIHGLAPAVVLTIPDALFLNGLTPLDATTLLAADSLLGRIYRLDLSTHNTSVWCEHELLRKITVFPFMPGANGLKIHGGYVYVSNTDRALLLRFPLRPDGSAGPIEVVAEHLRADDFAFDTAGNAYLTTHVENTLVRLAPDGTRLALAGPAEGMPGSTAIVFGRAPHDATAAYVTTTGGILAPYERTLQPAKLVRLELGVTGHPLLPAT